MLQSSDARDQSLLEVSHLTKSYPRPEGPGSLTVLDDINVRIAPGEFVSLLGPSGCGKTTLIRIMSGLIPFDDGRVLLRGETYRGVPDKVGFVFQEPALLPWENVTKNIAFALTARGDPRLPQGATVDGLVYEQLELTDLKPFAKYYPRQLSGGQQQRVGLARALVGQPDVLFMDEPLSALDAFTRRSLQVDVSKIIGATGTTTVLVTHDADEAIFMSDRVLAMSGRPGQIVGSVEVPLARPRSHESLTNDPEYAAIRAQLLSILLDVVPNRTNEP